MIKDCDFVADTEYEQLCVLMNKPCDYMNCEVYKNGLGKEDIERENQEMLEIRAHMNV